MLRNTPLATLEDYGLVTHDQDENVVRKGPRFDDINSLPDLSNYRDGEQPDDYP